MRTNFAQSSDDHEDVDCVKSILRFVRSEYVIATATFLLTTFVFFRPHILGKAYFWDDFIEQVYPNRVYAGRMLSAGEFPHWNPYSFCGMPFQADVQTALYYPPHMLFDRLIGAHTQNGVYWLQLLIIAHYVLAQFSMYILARRLSLSPIASGMAAIAYAFAAPLALHTHHPMFIEHLAWLPLLIVLIQTAVTTTSIAAIGWGGLVGGMMLLSGAPQMSLYALTLCAILAVWWSLTSTNISWLHRLRRIGKGVLLLVVAVGLYGIQYFPSRQLAAESERSSLTYEQATEGSLEPHMLLTAVVPKAYGVVLPPGVPNPMPYVGAEPSYLYWDTAFYFGVGVLLLALWTSIVAWKESALVKFLVVLSIGATLFALGSNGFLYPLIYRLPFFGQVRIPARMMFVVSFAASILAGIGWDRLRSGTSKRQQQIFYGIMATLGLVIIGVGSGALVSASDRVAHAIESSAWSQMVYVLLVGAAVLLRMRGVQTPWLGVAVAVIFFFDLTSAHASFSQGKINPANEYRAALNQPLRQLLVPRPPSDVFRVSMRRPEIIALKRNQGLVDGIMLFEGYNQLLLRRRHPAVASAEQVADLLAIRWTIERDSLGQWAFVQRPTAYPMAWLVHSAHVIAPDEVATRMRQDTTLDYRTIAVIEEELPFPLGNPTPEDSIAIAHYANDRVTYTVRCSAPALAVMSEIYYPAWSAYVDGERVPLLRANYCLRAVPITAGMHTLELRYEDATFTTGSLVTMASLASAITLLLLGAFRRLQQRPTTEHQQ